MTRTTINFWLDLTAFLAMVGLGVTGGITRFVLPPGTGKSHLLFGLGRHDYGTIHFYLGLAVVLLLAVHLALHWSWLCCYIAKGMGRGQPSPRAQRMLGIAVLAMVALPLVGGIAWGTSQVARRPSQGPQRGEPSREIPNAPPSERMDDAWDCPAGDAIDGRTTLREAAVATGLNMETLLNRLGLPGPADAEDRLGHLRRRHGLSIHDVRKLVCRPR